MVSLFQMLSLGSAADDVSYEDVQVGGYICGTSQKARVYFPTAEGQYPLISFAHGYLAGGGVATFGYKELLEDHARAGYVVIALESANGVRECADEWKDQMRSFEWMKTSDLASKVDYTLKTGILGHSLGGGATYHGSSQSVELEQHNIGVAAALHPQVRKPIPKFPIANPLVPIMFTTGSSDPLVSDSSVKDVYEQVTGVAKVFADVEGAGHFEPTRTGKNRLNGHIVAMFDCHIKGQLPQCEKVYGSNSDSLCVTVSVPLEECAHANEPFPPALV
jgi:predicted dienelactone hydrolase